MDAHAESEVQAGRGGSRPLDLRIGVEGDADAEAQLTRVRSGLCRIVDRLDVERHAVAAGRPNALEVPLGLGDHEMAVEHSSPLVDKLSDRAQHDRADRDLADEVAVADVEMEDAGAGVEQALQLLAEAGEVRGVDRRLDDARPCPLSSKSPAYSIPVGASDEKRLAAEAAAELVEAGMAVGLGTGTTVALLPPRARGASARHPVRGDVARDRACRAGARHPGGAVRHARPRSISRSTAPTR